ncbi:phage tail protein [Providencia vermicola]|uniref:phage tail protein n=1 Tax=Providencia vermicola TaxID=333965 RepID=UPI0034D6B420
MNTATNMSLVLTSTGQLNYGGKALMQVGDYGIGRQSVYSDIEKAIPTVNGIRTFDASLTNTINKNLIGMTLSWAAHGVGRAVKVFACEGGNAAYPNWYSLSYTGSDTIPFTQMFYTTANTTKDHNGTLKVSGSSNALSDYPVGAPIPWPQSTAPTGYLICNGQTFNKTTYPLLASAYPSGKLPDLRGEFIRGLDAGRGIDVNRTVLSSQRCATEHHKHISGWGEASNVNATFGKTVKSGYAGSGDSDHDNYLFYTNDGSEFQGSNPNSTGIMANETRPRNIAFLYIVRAA